MVWTLPFIWFQDSVPGDGAINDAAINLVKGLSDNILLTIKFLDMCKVCDVKRVVFVSSSSVYGLQTQIPIAESATTNPISSHGIEKLALEKYFLLYKFLYGIDVRIIRLSNPYGPGQSLFGRQGFIAISIGRLLKHKPILLRDLGRPIRDFIYIDDVSKALALAGTLEYGPSILNIGSSKGYSLAQVVALFEEILGQTIKVDQMEPKKIDILESVLNVSLAHDCIFFNTQISMCEGLVKTLQYHEILMPRRQMKVLHVITDLGQGGAESVLYELIKATHKTIDHNVVSLHSEGVYGSRLRQTRNKHHKLRYTAR